MYEKEKAVEKKKKKKNEAPVCSSVPKVSRIKSHFTMETTSEDAFGLVLPTPHSSVGG